MKKLHEFAVSKESEIDEVKVSKDEAGQEVKTTTKVKKLIPQRFVIVKPTRSMYDEADLYYGVKLSEGIKAGLLTRQLLAKRYSNDGGAMSEPEKQTYAALYVGLFEKQNEYQRLMTAKVEAERTQEEKDAITKVLGELNTLRQEIQEFEFSQVTLFDQTAESRARNKTILWWVLHLSHTEDEEGKQEPIFGNGSFNEKLDKHDEIVEAEDAFMTEAINKFLYYISFWYMGRAVKPEDFQAIDKQQTKTEETVK